MPKGFYEFVYWLNFKEDKYSNREIIDDYFCKIQSMLKDLNIKVVTQNFKNQFVAYLYEHSKFSGINKKFNYLVETPDENFLLKNEYHFAQCFREIKEDCISGGFNILDSNKFYQELNFIELILNNIEIHEEEDEEETDDDEEYYDY